jgi:hypothetical protein
MSVDRIKLAAIHAAVKERLKYQDKLEAQEAAHINEIRALKKAALKSVNDVSAKKRSRTNDRTEVYRAAIETATTPSDAHSVLRAMHDIALAHRFPHLIGYVPNEGFQWLAFADDDIPEIQNEKNALAAIRRAIKKASR